MPKKDNTTDPLLPALRILQMCGELQRMGYQQLQIYPAMSPSGVHWRLTIAPACCFSHWYRPPEKREGCYAHYSGGKQPLIFWTTENELTAQQLANKFVQTFPALVKRCRGRNQAYSRWLIELTETCVKQHTLPWFQADWPCDLSQGIPLMNGQTFRLPPQTFPGRWKKLLRDFFHC